MGRIPAYVERWRLRQMLVINRLVMIGLLSVGIIGATAAQAGNQLFTATWSVGSFGNECDGRGSTPYCTVTTGDYGIYQNWPMPQGFLCNPGQPRCPYVSTPVDGTPNASPVFAPLGGSQNAALYCTPYTIFTSGYEGGSNGRPEKGNTVFSPAKAFRPIPPVYRNWTFFTSAGQPNVSACTGTSTGYTTMNETRFGANKGKGMVGKPLAGTWDAVTDITGTGGFSFAGAALKANNGLRARTTGEFTNIYPYIYSYTYADFVNDAGLFGPGKGIGAFTHKYYQGGTVARMIVTPGPNQFGGTMRLLGQMTTKVCYYRNGGCSLGENDWFYDLVGTTASRATPSGPVTAPYVITGYAYYYQTAGSQISTVKVIGDRLPWTTGSVTVTARGRGGFKTVHYGHGYDNRNPVTGKGTIQLVSPVMTRWLQPASKLETTGIAQLRIKFVPEPQTWALLIAGASLLGVGYRMRGR